MFDSSSHIRIAHRGFTMIEMMIVIAIVIVLMGLVAFPYGYYMQRANVESAIDTVSQGWILAHKDIRNGKMFDAQEQKNANALLVFRKGSHEIKQYLFSGTVIPNISDMSPSDIREQNPISLGSQIEILGFSGITDDTLIYTIEAPYASGAFFVNNTLTGTNGVFVTLGYP